MQYRKFGKLDCEVSALGFGAMRLPVINGDSSKINEPEATRMIRYAIDQGVNYVDTAYPYHGGNSEYAVGRILKDGYREKVHLATKLPSWLVESYDDFDRYLNEQLQKLQTDHIDFYLLHSMNKNNWPKLEGLGVIEWAEKAKASGRIRHIGFSFHDDLKTFKQIVDANPGWDFCQIQHNYMDINNQAGTRGLRYAASKGLAVVIMEPLLGGRLVDPPVQVEKLWETAPIQRKPADWALQWLWNQPEISVVLSGMSTLQQVEENVSSASRSGIHSLVVEELELVDKVRDQYEELSPIPCTHCEYCLPCTNELDIPDLFGIFNAGKMYDKLESARDAYARFVPEGKKASDCEACRDCEEKCPQQILISEWMVHVDNVLSGRKNYDNYLEV
jgi:predicted aldo/keto reductase-like oxidoreductase